MIKGSLHQELIVLEKAINLIRNQIKNKEISHRDFQVEDPLQKENANML